MKIIFARHGQTTWNVENRLQGQTNESKLTEAGLKQAEELSVKLKEEEFDVIIVSPLDRTIQTANIINKDRNIKMIIEDALLERAYGQLEGEYACNGKYDIQNLWNYDNNYSENEVEPIRVFFERIYAFLDKIIRENKYKKVLIVSHSGVGIAVKTYFQGLPQDKNLLKLGIGTCESIKFETDDKDVQL